jgi:hypothetical protein
MLKFKTDTRKLTQDLDTYLTGVTKQAVGEVAFNSSTKALGFAKGKLKNGLKHWMKGFEIKQIGNGEWVLVLTGKLAVMMEDGFGTDDIRKMILSGNRAKVNKSKGKNYVDVPMEQNVSETGDIGKSGVNISMFKDADDVLKSIEKSDWKKGGTFKQKQYTNRVQDIIRNKAQKDSKAKFVKIVRISENGKPVPSKPYKGLQAFKMIEDELEDMFEQGLKKVLGG